jgi:hypothetical protein
MLFCEFFYCCIKWFIIQLDLGFQPELASLSHFGHEDWTHCNSNSKWKNGEIDYKQIGRILVHIKEKQGIEDCINHMAIIGKKIIFTILELWLIF